LAFLKRHVSAVKIPEFVAIATGVANHVRSIAGPGASTPWATNINRVKLGLGDFPKMRRGT
jgi:hypothetical protein